MGMVTTWIGLETLNIRVVFMAPYSTPAGEEVMKEEALMLVCPTNWYHTLVATYKQ